MNKIAVYTCITGGYEDIKDKQNFDGADFYFFTDNKDLIIEGWTTRQATSLFSDPRRNSRFHKILSHEFFPEYEYTIWLDGSVGLLCSPHELITELGTAQILTSFHPERKTIQAEGEECKRLKLDYPDIIDKHIASLLKDDFKDDVGLAETKFVVRRNSEKVKEFNTLWFYKMMTGSVRDQLTFPYVVWKTHTHTKFVKPVSYQPDKFMYSKSPQHKNRKPYEAIS